MVDQPLTRVVILQGASGSFGRRTALKLARPDCALILGGAPDHLLEQCRTAGAQAVTTSTEAMVEVALARHGHVDAWINMDGAGALGLFGSIPLADHHRVLHGNLVETLTGSWHAIRYFRQVGHGLLINVVSVAGDGPQPYYSSFVAAAQGVVGLTDAIRQELQTLGLKEAVRVCLVMCGSHDSIFFDPATNYTGHPLKAIPALVQADAVAEAVLRLLEQPQDEVTVGNPPVETTLLAHHLEPVAPPSRPGRKLRKRTSPFSQEQPLAGGPLWGRRDISAP